MRRLRWCLTVLKVSGSWSAPDSSGASKQGADRAAISFCGTQKSLIMGIPMANALFSGTTLGFVVLPMIVYHQMQFMSCAALARHYATGDGQGMAELKV